ncbi:hypothetical protein BDN72DRAFT_332350 [Pluteus cervinus]|uniref:Uncharacterized protein n=1 Tax=Pluteus cervinus TaxID=181527 RepID=A0ACD3ABU1_9AGAR|nr:hypothetical protein BDN72DRAFT_332350 [Pluteus cervinus]
MVRSSTSSSVSTLGDRPSSLPPPPAHSSTATSTSPGSKKNKRIEMVSNTSGVASAAFKEGTSCCNQIIGLASFIVQTTQSVRSNKEAYKLLLKDVDQLSVRVLQAFDGSPEFAVQQEIPAKFQPFIDALVDIKAFAVKRTERNIFARVVKSTADLNEIKLFEKRLRQAIDFLWLESQITICQMNKSIESISKQQDELLHIVKWLKIREKKEEVLEKQRMGGNSYDVGVEGGKALIGPRSTVVPKSPALGTTLSHNVEPPPKVHVEPPPKVHVEEAPMGSAHVLTTPTKARTLLISMGDPRLPPELEHEIFLIAFQNNFGDAWNLISTAKRVHDWFLPQAFEVVILGREPDFPVPFTLEKFERYGLYIRSLSLARPWILNGRHEDFPDYISHCPNITNLLMRTPYFTANPLQDALAVLPLTHLVIEVRFILSTPPSPQLLQLFTNITHLHLDGSLLLVYTPKSNPPYIRPLFPNLTHISFNGYQNRENIRLAIQGWNELRVVVLWRARPYPEQPCKGRRPDLQLHPRLVGVQSDLHRQWEDNARGRGPDLWEYSEEIFQLWTEEGST